MERGKTKEIEQEPNQFNRRIEMAKQWSTPPAMQIDPKKKYQARMETDKRTMVIELFADKTPKTVNKAATPPAPAWADPVINMATNFIPA
jgi:hypothetical protein